MLTETFKQFPLVYLGTPYSKYREGLDAAAEAAAIVAARLTVKGINIYSPIVHCHQLAKHGGIDPLAHEFWMKVDAAMMAKSDALLICKLGGWASSTGIRLEKEEFERCEKTVSYVCPFDLKIKATP